MTYEEVRALYDYDPEGYLVHKKGRHQHVGKRAGFADIADSGYWVIERKGRWLKAHRLIWLWHYGSYPVHSIDHINRVRTDNRIENLRDATPTQQNQNTAYAQKNMTGYRGVNFRKDKNRYRGVVKAEGKKYYTRNYKTAEEAYEAYCELAIRLYGADACLV